MNIIKYIKLYIIFVFLLFMYFMLYVLHFYRWVYTRTGATTWAQQGAKLVPTGTISAVPKIGDFSVRMSRNGKFLVVSTATDDANKGGVFVYYDDGK